MDMINVSDLTSGYRERMRRLALIEPLFELDRRRVTDAHGRAIDMRGLGMLTLLFFFERRLTREYKTGVVHLTDFLIDVTRNMYTVERPDMEEIARSLITTFRPSTGKKRSFVFFNWGIDEEDEITYSIIKDNDFDAATQTQFYTLDDDGLELLFATKEFYSEFQISINQLLLRQQIKKGEFHGALRQIREMELDVNTLKDNMEKMKLEILRNIVSEETYERYKKLLEETHIRFEREDEEFKALKQFIQETRETLYTGDTKDQEANSYQLMMNIETELEEVHYAHARLIEMTTELRTTALATAQESLYYTGIQTFNFAEDIVLTLLSKPYALDKMKGVVHPFLRVEENERWSLLTVFAEQNIIEEREVRDDDHFIEVADDTEGDKQRAWLAKKYAELMANFLRLYDEEKANTLKEWLEHVEVEEPELVQERYVYSFWLMLHHYSPLIYEGAGHHESETVLHEALRQIGRKKLTVKELPDIIHVEPKFSIQNMRLILEEVEDDALR